MSFHGFCQVLYSSLKEIDLKARGDTALLRPWQPLSSRPCAPDVWALQERMLEDMNFTEHSKTFYMCFLMPRVLVGG